MTKISQYFILTCLCAAAAGPFASASIILPILSPAGFVSPTTFTNDFETVVNTPQFTFDSTAELDTADLLSGGVTSSGMQGLKEFQNQVNPNGPLNVTFPVPVHEIGMFFGNDDFNFQFNAILEVFDAANVSLGNVQVPANVNDFVDQYIGLRSDTPIKSAVISYQRPQAQQLAIFIDDFKIGIGVDVPEPAGAAIAALLSLMAGIRFRHRN